MTNEDRGDHLELLEWTRALLTNLDEPGFADGVRRREELLKEVVSYLAGRDAMRWRTRRWDLMTGRRLRLEEDVGLDCIRVTQTKEGEALLKIRNVLFPGGDLDHEWDGADDLSEIAEIIGSVAAINNTTNEGEET